jgi:hypothetical protein
VALFLKLFPCPSQLYPPLGRRAGRRPGLSRPGDSPAHSCCTRAPRPAWTFSWTSLYTCKTLLYRSGAEEIRIPDLRRAKADHYILSCTTASGKPAYLCSSDGFWAARISAAHRPVPARCGTVAVNDTLRVKPGARTQKSKRVASLKRRTATKLESAARSCLECERRALPGGLGS